VPLGGTIQAHLDLLAVLLGVHAQHDVRVALNSDVRGLAIA